MSFVLACGQLNTKYYMLNNKYWILITQNFDFNFRSPPPNQHTAPLCLLRLRVDNHQRSGGSLLSLFSHKLEKGSAVWMDLSRTEPLKTKMTQVVFIFLKVSTHNLASSEVRTYTKILVGQCPNLGIWAKQFQFGFALGKNLYNSVLLMENILDFFGWFERLSCYVVTIGKISRHIKIRVPSINPLFLSKSVLRSRKREYFLLFLNLRLFFYPDRPTYRAWSCDGRFSSSLCSISSKLSIGFPCFFHSLCLNSVLPQSAFPEVDFL